MEKRQLGDTDLELTVIGLGTWAIGGGDWAMGWGPQDERDSVEAILEAFEKGINWIDTAAAYGFGRSEEAVGKAMKEWGEPIIIATKCGVLPAEKGQAVRHISRGTILKEVDASLKRLQVGCIDLYQIHWPVPDENIEEAFQTLLYLKEQGKIKWAGVSNFSVEQLERISRSGSASSLQPPYSLLERGIENEILPWCRNSNTGVITYSPMQNGLLTGKVDAQWVNKLPENDWRKRQREDPRMRYVREPFLTPFIHFIDALKNVAVQSDHTVAQLAVSWVLSREGITAAIVGARKKGQISETAKACDWMLRDEELREIEAAYVDFQGAIVAAEN
ncbi:MAG: hypothetical protein BBJ60_07045 [Desulfobacterales bacterium S7086C20]|nr:MAG: hypothetical protein BBJ60_07045 [Desulfobacterales bacterium S7086C20]